MDWLLLGKLLGQQTKLLLFKKLQYMQIQYNK